MLDTNIDKCFTVQKLIDELNKIEDKDLLVLDSANDFIEEIIIDEIANEKVVRLM